MPSPLGASAAVQRWLPAGLQAEPGAAAFATACLLRARGALRSGWCVVVWEPEFQRRGKIQLYGDAFF